MMKPVCFFFSVLYRPMSIVIRNSMEVTAKIQKLEKEKTGSLLYTLSTKLNSQFSSTKLNSQFSRAEYKKENLKNT